MRVSGLMLAAAVLAAAAASGAAVHPLQDAVGLRGAQDDYSASAALANVYAAAAAYCDEVRSERLGEKGRKRDEKGGGGETAFRQAKLQHTCVCFVGSLWM